MCKGDDLLAFCVLSAAVAVATARWTGRTDAVLLIPPLCVLPSGTDSGLPPRGGYAERWLALSVPAQGDLAADLVLRHVRRETIALYARQRHAPILENAPECAIVVYDERLHGHVRPCASIAVHMDTRGGRYDHLVSDANSGMYTAPLHGRFSDACAAIMDEMVDDPFRNLTRLVDAAERDKETRASLRFGARPREADGTLIDMFEKQARRTSDRIALTCGEHRITYAELHAQSNAVAVELTTSHRAVPGSIIGLALDRSIAAVAAAIGIIKAGCGYVPVPTDQPRERNAALLAAAEASLVVTNRPDREVAELFGAAAVDISGLGSEHDTNVHVNVAGPLCVLPTSGSTGNPCPVVINESAVMNRLRWMWRTEPFSSDEKLVLVKSLGLVGSLWECFGGLLQGVPAVIASAIDLRDPSRLWRLLNTHGITRLHTAPTILTMLLDEADRRKGETLQPLRQVFSSAEPLPPAIAARWRRRFPAHRLTNLYGLTECTSNVAVYRVDDEAARRIRIPIGAPIDHVAMYVLDGHGRPVPEGAVGELYVGGRCVGSGYAGMLEHTERGFVKDPFWLAEVGIPGRMFRTGDLARVMVDGNVELLGRRNLQVKIRGFRVNLEEVEEVIVRHPHVAVAAAVLVEDMMGQQLVAYIVPRRGSEQDSRPTAVSLRAHCATLLPGYMVPGEFVFVDDLPRLPSGKVARTSLLAPEREPAPTTSRDGLHGVGVVLDAVMAVTGRTAVLTDRLEDLDVHSLRMVQLQLRLSESFGDGVDLLKMFQCATVADLCALVLCLSGEHAGDTTPTPWNSDDLRGRARRLGYLAALRNVSR